MLYAIFGMPIFMLWASNVGTLLAQVLLYLLCSALRPIELSNYRSLFFYYQSFTFLYANVCCFICRRGKRKKERRAREREREARACSDRESTRLLWSEKDGSPGLAATLSRPAPAPAPAPDPGSHHSGPALKLTDPRVKELLSTCATYNLNQVNEIFQSCLSLVTKKSAGGR